MIRTNGHWRPFVYRVDVPAKILESQFDWIKVKCDHCGQSHWPENDYTDGFIHYKGHWYHLADFINGGPEGWHGTHTDSYFSGQVIRLSDDGETYQIGTWIAD